jgi:hypothetical protein
MSFPFRSKPVKAWLTLCTGSVLQQRSTRGNVNVVGGLG